MVDGPWLYYKLTNEPKGSGELKKHTSEWSFKTINKQYIRGLLKCLNKRLELLCGLQTGMVRGKKQCFRASEYVRYLVYCNS